jgi:hypothetical protein
MKVYFTLSAVLWLAFWLFLLGIVLGAGLLDAAAGPAANDPGTSSIDTRHSPAPPAPVGDGRG